MDIDLISNPSGPTDCKAILQQIDGVLIAIKFDRILISNTNYERD